ncbi:MAG TPA: hypothetical protein VGJ84_12970, partial [Polyangiaceae bacterium]
LLPVWQHVPGCFGALEHAWKDGDPWRLPLTPNVRQPKIILACRAVKLAVMFGRRCVVEAALAEALRGATTAGQSEVVSQLARGRGAGSTASSPR